MSQFFASAGQSIGSFSFNTSPSNEHSGLISFRMDWLDFQGTLKSLLQHHSSKASILLCSAFFIVQLSLKWCIYMHSVQFSCPTLWDPMNLSTPGLPVYHQLPEFTQTHVHRVGDTIQPSHPLSSPYSAPNPSQHQSLFQRVNSSHEVAKVLEFQLSAPVLPMNTQNWSPLGWTGWISLQSKGLSRVFSNTTVQKHQFFCDQLSL